MSDLVKQLVRPEIQALSSYHVPPSQGLLKMDAMENPNAWPGSLFDQWQQAVSSVEVNRYPDPNASELKLALRKLMNLDALESSSGKELDILLGNGSDEIIQIIAMALADSDRCVMAPEPSFVMYGMISKFVGMPYVGVPLNDEFDIDLDVFLKAIQEHDPALVFLAVPNNPTGNVFSLEAIQSLVEACNGLVVIDEAYLAFTDSDLLEFCAHYDNVVVMRTLSKVGLAGLRLGFLIGQPVWLSEFDKLRLPYNINSFTQASACFALEHFETLKAQTENLREQRANLFNQLALHPKLEPFESEANFILVRLLDSDARDVFERLKAKGVLIKCLDGGHPALANCLRLTVGTESENNTMWAALESCLEAS